MHRGRDEQTKALREAETDRVTKEEAKRGNIVQRGQNPIQFGIGDRLPNPKKSWTWMPINMPGERRIERQLPAGDSI